MQWPIIPIQNLTSLFPLLFLSKHISVYALGRLMWILDIIWPLNQHFKLKNQRNRLKQVWMLKIWSVIKCIFVHWMKKLTLETFWFVKQILKRTFERVQYWGFNVFTLLQQHYLFLISIVLNKIVCNWTFSFGVFLFK